MVDRAALAAVEQRIDVLRRLQAHLTEFNVFDLFGTAHLELAHTRILAFLFDPRGHHGFGAAFGDRFLRAVADVNDPDLVRRHFGAPMAWVFEPSIILREQESMDLRVVDPTNRIAVLVENKVHTSEHDDQLSRYWSTMLGHYPPDEWRAVPIYLTLVGDPPTDPTYLAGDYRMVARVLEGLLADGAFDCPAPVRMTLEHYGRMIRRELVGDWDLAAQAKRLYDQAPEAFEFVVANKHYPRSELQAFVSRLVTGTPDLTKEPEEPIHPQTGAVMVRFSHPAFDTVEAPDRSFRPFLWTESRRMLLFQFDVTDRSVVLGLFVGPGPETERAKLIEIAERWCPPFDLSLRRTTSGTKRWRGIYRYELARPDDFVDLDLSVLQHRLRERWNHFLVAELPRILVPFAEEIPEEGD